jgi:hypothetical protein
MCQFFFGGIICFFILFVFFSIALVALFFQVLEERDRVVAMLSDFETTRVLYEQYAISNTIATSGPQLEGEFEKASRLFSTGMLRPTNDSDLAGMIARKVITSEVGLWNQIVDISDRPFDITGECGGLETKQLMFLTRVEHHTPSFASSRKDSKAWAALCFSQLRRDKFDDLNQDLAMQRFVALARKCPTYGCQFFSDFEIISASTEIQVVVPSFKVNTKVTLGIWQEGIKIFDPKSLSPIFLISFPRLEAHRCSLISLSLEWSGEGNFHHSLAFATVRGNRVSACISWFMLHYSKKNQEPKR